MDGFAPIRTSRAVKSTRRPPPGRSTSNESCGQAARARWGSAHGLRRRDSGAHAHQRDRALRGAGTADSALLVPLGEAQRLFDKPGQIEGVLISNRGHGDAAVALTDKVVDTLKPTCSRSGSRRLRRRRTRSTWPTRPAPRSCRCSRRSGRSRSPRDPAHLPDLRHARGRAPRRARDRTRSGNAPRTPGPDVQLRRCGIRPDRRRRRSAARRRRRLRNGVRDGKGASAPQTRTPGSRSPTS